MGTTDDGTAGTGPGAAPGQRRRGRTRRAATAGALLAAAVTLSLAAGCSSGRGGPDDGQGHTAGQSPSPTTSRGHTGPVLAVKIDNVVPARPQTGLNAADIVYAEQVEGGLSRLMAVYATRLPPVVGPVRSARESDLELLRQFDHPVLAFSGAQSKLLPLIDAAPVKAESADSEPGAYFRGSGKPAPHNLFLRPARLLGSPPGAGALTTGFRYGPAPSGGRAETSRTVRYPAARFTFTWSAQRHGWQVAMDGTPTVTTDGGPVTPATVVVQHVKVRRSSLHDFLGNYTPYTETVGSGKAEVLRDGRVHDVTWKRPGAADGTSLTAADGTPVNLARGQVWVVLTADE
ncbi:DUF3048 domain-containing protein [Streptomyces anandii]|uniref:DUF3048 domain-containing protein n=1 Tax=Streptomyces anandii TaxID=285454 RepID=UPI001E4C1923|nr:DUF3048 domain-containing protein [Streptomyces anandii]